MFKQALIHYPADKNTLKQILKDIAVLRCIEIVKYIESLKLNKRQTEILFISIAEEIAEDIECVT